MSRAKDFDEDKVLEAAMFLFWEKGYEATSMQALEKNMGLKRTSIYNAFGNKRSLFQQVLQRYLSVILSRFLTVLNEASTAKQAMVQVLNEVLHLHFNKDHPGGCLVVLSLMENQQHDENTNELLNSALKQLNEAIFMRLEQGIEDGDLKNNINSRAISDQVTALITGMIVMAKANFQKNELENIIQNFQSTLMI